MERLRKALEEAKKERGQQPQAPEPGPAASPAKQDQKGWVSPVYDQCCPVELDPERVSEQRCLGVVPGAAELEHYKVLRTHIVQRTRQNGQNTLMVTSPNPGEGKTLTAINLSFALAMEFSHTVLLVDCDLRQQKVHQYLCYSSDRGLADYFLDNRPIRDLIVWPGVEKMSLISGSRTISDSAELLGSPRMKDLVAEMKSRYPDRYVVFDVPPILAGADALTFAEHVDAVIMVVQADKTSVDEVEHALELIPREKFLGFVLNRKRSRAKGYDGYYVGR